MKVMESFSVAASDSGELVVKTSSSLLIVSALVVVGATVVVVVVVDVAFVVAVVVFVVVTGVVLSMASKTISGPPLPSIWWTVCVLAALSFGEREKDYDREFNVSLQCIADSTSKEIFIIYEMLRS